MSKERMGEVLVRHGLISEEQLAAALTKQKESGGRLGDVLVRTNVVGEEEIAAALAEQKELPHEQLASMTVDPEVVHLLPVKLMQRKLIFPIGYDSNRLVLAMSDPLDVEAIDDVEMLTGHSVTPIVVAASQISAAIEKYVIGAKVLEQLEADYGLPEVPEEVTVVHDVADDEASVVRLINQTVRDAIQAGASDVHFEPEDTRVLVRHRVDGVLRETAILPKGSQAGLTSRIKIMAEMDISERRRPQDGRIAFNAPGGAVDLRVATVPTPAGEGIVLRILHRGIVIGSLDDLGLSARDRVVVDKILSKPYGALLLAGPTGSGKTTTLFTALNELNSPAKKIVTVEDPIEYRFPGITQIAVNQSVGLTFAVGLRSVLRFDPDIVMVGEIRDTETAAIAVRAALTGHYVLSSIHTNDAASALTRLNEMGIEPYITSSAILGIIAQRLVRLLCPACKQPQTISVERLVAAGFSEDLAPDLEVFGPVGCHACRHTGYRGRIGIFEILEVDDDIARLAMQNVSSGEIRDVGVAKGMTLIRQNALARVAAGVTSLEEVDRVVI